MTIINSSYVNYPYYVAGDGVGVCSQKNNQDNRDRNNMIGAVIVLLAIILIAISTYCICINWNGKKSNKNKKNNSNHNTGETNQQLISNQSSRHRRNSFD